MPKQLKQKTAKGSQSAPPGPITDSRFTNLQTDPRFRLPSRKNTHVTLDKRFAHMLRDEEFSGRAKVDRYGRKLPKKAGGNVLEKYYRIEDGHNDGEDHDDEQVELQGDLDRKAKGYLPTVRAEESQEEDTSSSSSSDEDEDSMDEANEEEEVFGLLESQGDGIEGIPKGEVSSRLAIVNLDWDNIRAADLMAVFSSFVPTGGRILRISIYPSEFGRERMEREEMEGPPKEIFGQRQDMRSQPKPLPVLEQDEEELEDGMDGDESDDDEQIKQNIIKEDNGNEFNSAKLRRYQLERLRYFYAVMTCSSSAVAQAIYDAVDGTEYLTTANFFDLRYIPDSTDFSQDKALNECDRIPDGYRPNEFVTDALQHSKVRLTWDADDGERKEAQKRAFKGGRKDIDENDLKAYLGSDTSEDEAPEPVTTDAKNDLATVTTFVPEEEDGTAPKLSKKEIERQKMRNLLGLASEPAPKRPKEAPIVGDLQVTFSSGLTSHKNDSVFENTPEEAQETTVERYVRKEKERKARRKERSKATRSTGDDDDAKADRAGEQAVEEEHSAAEADTNLGFNDPFFSTDKPPTGSSQRKADKRSKRKTREAEEAAAAAEQAKLSLLMANDNPSNSKDKEIQHFDIKALSRAEKAALKAKKRRKGLSERDKEALEMKEKDAFEMDVGDERFRDVFERSEFAIDPNHPRFLGTEGMRRLLDERRKARGSDEDGEEEKESGAREKKKKKRKHREGNEVEELVRRVKAKAVPS